MSNTQTDKQFWELADSFIHLANDHCKGVPRSQVSAAMLYAASRFNAFVVFAGTNSKEQFVSEKEAAISNLLEQFETMLRENLDDHENDYEKYKR